MQPFSAPNYQPPAASRDASFAPLAIDSAAGEGIARFRECPAGNITSSGSAQFSCGGWEWLRRHVGESSPAAFLVVDLRKESHGFLNGAAVSWYAADGNWGASGLASGDAMELERLRLLLLEKSAEVWLTTKQQIMSATPARDLWKVEAVLSEQAMVQRAGAVSYVRIGVDDHCPPTGPALTALLDLFASLRPGSHVHFHCRGGKGRTATAMTLLDIHQNAAHASFAEIVERQEAVNAYPLSKPGAPGLAKSEHLDRRWELLRSFYDHCAQRDRPPRAF